MTASIRGAIDQGRRRRAHGIMPRKLGSKPWLAAAIHDDSGGRPGRGGGLNDAVPQKRTQVAIPDNLSAM